MAGAPTLDPLENSREDPRPLGRPVGPRNVTRRRATGPGTGDHPATGTGTFPVEVIDLIPKTMTAKWQAEDHGKKKIEKLYEKDKKKTSKKNMASVTALESQKNREVRLKSISR